MSQGKPHFQLPGRLDHCLSLLEQRFSERNDQLLREIVVHAQASVAEGAEYNNWNGGTHHHEVTLALPNELFLRIVDDRNELEWQIRDELQRVALAPNESFNQVNLIPLYEYEEDWRERTGIYKPPAVRFVTPDVRKRIWGEYRVRVFLSHRDSIKAEVHELKKRLQDYGIGAFVAHESIEASLDWQQEIEEALRSMDLLVALLTEDFSNSNWTDQEVGFALGRQKPVITVSLGRDPYGFMGRHQALRGVRLSDPAAIAEKLFELLKDRIVGEQRMLDAAIDAFAASTSFHDSGWKADNVLPYFDRPTQAQIDRIVSAFKVNNQNYGSFDAQRRLPALLRKWTGNDWRFNGQEIVPLGEEVAEEDFNLIPEDDLPF